MLGESQPIVPLLNFNEICSLLSGNPGNVSNLGQFCDPFTGSGAYVSGSGGVPTAKDYASGSVGLASDPFTGLDPFSCPSEQAMITLLEMEVFNSLYGS